MYIYTDTNLYIFIRVYKQEAVGDKGVQGEGLNQVPMPPGFWFRL
jgi:hypothetical protein